MCMIVLHTASSLIAEDLGSCVFGGWGHSRNWGIRVRQCGKLHSKNGQQHQLGSAAVNHSVLIYNCFVREKSSNISQLCWAHSCLLCGRTRSPGLLKFSATFGSSRRGSDPMCPTINSAYGSSLPGTKGGEDVESWWLSRESSELQTLQMRAVSRNTWKKLAFPHCI